VARSSRRYAAVQTGNRRQYQNPARNLQLSMQNADMAKPRPDRPDRNHILAALPPGDYRRVASKLEPAPFGKRQPLHEPEKRISHVYFPRTGVASIVARMSQGGTIEVATIGNEGVVGVSAYLGNGRSSMEVFV
jgi:hypothetical protein